MRKIMPCGDFLEGTGTERKHQAILFNPASHCFQEGAWMAKCPSQPLRGPLGPLASLQPASFGAPHSTSVNVGRPECGSDYQRPGSFLRFVSAASLAWNSLQDNGRQYLMDCMAKSRNFIIRQCWLTYLNRRWEMGRGWGFTLHIN